MALKSEKHVLKKLNINKKQQKIVAFFCKITNDSFKSFFKYVKIFNTIVI